MGYYINVNHKQFETTASAIEAYIRKQDSYMTKADTQINKLIKSWKGNDAKDFKSKWETVNDEQSATKNMRKSLKNYAGTLRYAAAEYKKAQKEAVNEANTLPRW